ncbi:hypothetical protein HispidOSU_000896, partial [Sigmodon hispidus]
TSPASFLPDQNTTSPRHKPTSTPLMNKTAADVSSGIVEPQTSSAPPRVYSENTNAEMTQMMTSEHHPTTAAAFESDIEPITNAKLKVTTEKVVISVTISAIAKGQASPDMTVQPENASAGLEVTTPKSQI